MTVYACDRTFYYVFGFMNSVGEIVDLINQVMGQLTQHIWRLKTNELASG